LNARPSNLTAPAWLNEFRQGPEPDKAIVVIQPIEKNPGRY
jgi:hypothetical protein